MRFEAEVDLVAALKFALSEIYQDRIKILEEVTVGYGIADLVVTSFGDTRASDFELESKLTINDINIYCLVKTNAPIDNSGIQEITRLSRKKINESLDKLLELAYIEIKDEFLYASREYTFKTHRNFAIEAKLKDWKRALNQAFRYKWFAEYSFVVLDEHYSKPALKNIDIFRRYNIGLATISSSGHFQRHYHPKPAKPVDKRMQMLFSEKVKTEL